MNGPPPPPSRPGKKDVQVVRANYTYEAQRSDELSLKEGDVLIVLSKDDPNWWLCKLADSQGLVPANYVGENSMVITNPLHEAAKRGNVEFVNELVNAGVSVNGLDKAGNTPLHWACRGGHLEVVKAILEKSPNIAAQNKMGDSVLHLAAWGGHANVIEFLLQLPGIQPNLKNKEGETAVQVAKNDDSAAALLRFAGKSNATALAGSEQDDDD